MGTNLTSQVVNKDGDLDAAPTISGADAWRVYFSFFSEEMKNIKPSALTASETRDAERLLISLINIARASSYLRSVLPGIAKFAWDAAKGGGVAPLGLLRILKTIRDKADEAMNWIPDDGHLLQIDNYGIAFANEIRRKWRSAVTVMVNDRA